MDKFSYKSNGREPIHKNELIKKIKNIKGRFNAKGDQGRAFQEAIDLVLKIL